MSEKSKAPEKKKKNSRLKNVAYATAAILGGYAMDELMGTKVFRYLGWGVGAGFLMRALVG